MKARYDIRILLLSSLFVLSFVAEVDANQTGDTVRVEILDYGIYEKVKNFETFKDTDSVTGYRSESETNDSVALIRETNKIPLTKGIIFGLRARIVGVKHIAPTPITVRYEFPRIHRPDGISSTFYQFDILINDSDALAGGGMMYSLSEDYEMVGGEWRFVLLSNGRLLTEIVFILGD